MSGPIRQDVFQEPDQVPRGLLLRIAVGTLAVGLSLCVIAYLLLRAREHTLEPSFQFPRGSLPAPHAVAGVRQEPFDIPAPRLSVLQEQSRELQRYGWVDHARGLIRVPIDVGMQLVLDDARTAGSRR
jgi:hypothetical protein